MAFGHKINFNKNLIPERSIEELERDMKELEMEYMNEEDEERRNKGLDVHLVMMERWTALKQ